MKISHPTLNRKFCKWKAKRVW